MVNMLRKDALKFQLELGNYSHISIFCAEGTQPGYSYYENFFVFILKPEAEKNLENNLLKNQPVPSLASVPSASTAEPGVRGST